MAHPCTAVQVKSYYDCNIIRSYLSEPRYSLSRCSQNILFKYFKWVLLRAGAAVFFKFQRYTLCHDECLGWCKSRVYLISVSWKQLVSYEMYRIKKMSTRTCSLVSFFIYTLWFWQQCRYLNAPSWDKYNFFLLI